MNIEEKIKKLEEEIKNTPKNKGTEVHLAKLKSKLSALKELLETRQKSSKRGGKSYGIKKQGDATVSMIGFPSVGKSSLLNVLSNAKSKVGEYAFTTVSLIPGMMYYQGVYIQIFDLPGIIESAAEGVGMGKEILSYARASDLLLLVVDPTHSIERQLETLHSELYKAGFRINKKKPDVTIHKKASGGLEIFIAKHVPLKESEVKEICSEFNIHNAEIIIRDASGIEDIYDAFFSNRVYIKSITVVNKIDMLSEHEKKKLKEEYPNWIFISAKTGEGVDTLKDRIIKELELVRIYTKKPKQKIDEIDFEHPLVLRKPAYVKDVAEKLGLSKGFKYAKIWGTSVKFPGQRVGMDHLLQDRDIIEINTG